MFLLIEHNMNIQTDLIDASARASSVEYIHQANEKYFRSGPNRM